MDKFLLIRLKKEGRVIKTWHLNGDKPFCFVGSSFYAPIRLDDKGLSGIEGAFELREGRWWYVNLNVQNKIKTPKGEWDEAPVQEGLEVPLGGGHLTFASFDSRTALFDEKTPLIFEEKQTREEPPPTGKGKTGLKKGKRSVSGASGDKTRWEKKQMVVVRKGGRVVETYTMSPHRSFRFKLNNKTRKFPPPQSTDWVCSEEQGWQIRQCLVKTPVVDSLAKGSLYKSQDKGVSKYISGAMICYIILIMIGYYAPKNQSTLMSEERLAVKQIPVEALVKKRKKPKIKDTAKIIKPKVLKFKKNTTDKAKARKVLSSLKKSGLSRLVGKLSKSTKGFSLNKQSKMSRTAASLALAGSLRTASTKSIKLGGTGTKVAISTVGGGGQKGYTGKGGLKAGKVGSSGGVNVLAEETQITGGLPKEVIARYIKSKLGLILHCYERQLSIKPDLFGKVEVKFTIGATGSIIQKSIKKSTLANKVVESCILRKIARWQFPKPKGGGKVVVKYPFMFKSRQ